MYIIYYTEMVQVPTGQYVSLRFHSSGAPFAQTDVKKLSFLRDNTLVSQTFHHFNLLFLTEFCKRVFTADTHTRSLQTFKIGRTPLC